MEQINKCKSKILECVKNFPVHELKYFMAQWDFNFDNNDKWQEIKDQDLISHIKEYINKLDPKDLESFEKWIFNRLENLKDRLKYKAIERIKNLSDKTLEGFSNLNLDLKNFFATQENIGSNIKSEFENYIETLSNDALALEKFLSGLSSFVKTDIIREFDEAYKNFSSSKLKDAANEFEDHKFGGFGKARLTLDEISPQITNILEKYKDGLKDNFGIEAKKGSKLNLKVFCENMFKWDGSGFEPYLDNVLKATLNNLNNLHNSYFKKFERGNYYGGNCDKSDWLCSARLLYCLNKVSLIKSKRREFLSKLNLDTFAPDKEYGKLELNNISLNADEPETEKTCLRWKEIYIIKYVSQIKNILFDENLSDTEKLDKINGLTKNITWDEFKKISFISPDKLYILSCSKNKAGEGQVPAYLFLYEFFWIYKREFYSLIEDNKDLKKMFDAQKITNLIGFAVEAPKLIRVLKFVCYLIVTVLSLGFFARKNNVRDGLKSLSKSSFQRATLKDIMDKFKALSEELKKKPLSKLKAETNDNDLQGKKDKEETRD